MAPPWQQWSNVIQLIIDRSPENSVCDLPRFGGKTVANALLGTKTRLPPLIGSGVMNPESSVAGALKSQRADHDKMINFNRECVKAGTRKLSIMSGST